MRSARSLETQPQNLRTACSRLTRPESRYRRCLFSMCVDQKYCFVGLSPNTSKVDVVYIFRLIFALAIVRGRGFVDLCPLSVNGLSVLKFVLCV